MPKDLSGAMAGCFGVIIYGIAIHFVYRYFALEQHGRIKYFERKYLPFWFLIPLIGGACWTLVSWFLFPMTPMTSAYIGPDLLASVNINVNQSAYAAAVLFPTRENGVKSFNWQCGMGLIGYLVIMAVPFYVVIFVGVKSAGKIKQLPSSCYAKRLQMELYKALVAQTVIPIILLFVPFAVIFLCPIMEIDCTSLATILTFVYAIYPVVDPLPIFFFVHNYRNALRDVFFCRERSNSSKIHAAPEDASREEYST